jgi:hypothetical protein
MGAIRYRAMADLRRSWKTVAALALLLGLVGTVVLTAFAGARRSSTAFERFREQARAADVTIFTSDPSRLDAVARLPQVAAVGRLIVPFFAPLGPGDVGDFRIVTTPGGILTDIDRVRVVEGRLPAPDRADELAVSEALASALELGVGEEVVLRSFAAEQFASADGAQRGPEGPVIPVRVVGVVRSVYDVSGAIADDRPSGYLSPAFFRSYGDEVASFDAISRIRLRNGSAAVNEFSEAVAPIFADDPEFSLAPDSIDVSRVEDSINVIATGLRLFAVAAAIAGLTALVQGLSLLFARQHGDGYVLASLGMTRWHRLGSALLLAGPALLGGGVLAVIGAAIASPLMPIDVARRAEPDPGISVDGLVLGLGGFVLVTTATALCLLAAWRATSTRQARTMASTSSTASVAMQAVAGARLPLPMATGAHMAFHGGSGRTAVPVRSGLIGAMVGAASLVAVVVFIHSQDALARTPSLYGWNWDASVVGENFEANAELADNVDAEVVADPALSDLSVVRISHAVFRGTYLHVLGFSDLKGSVAPTVLRGRAPSRPTEVALGAATARTLGLTSGDRVEVPGVDGPVTLEVVGEVVIPSLGTDALADEGAVMTGDGADRLATTQSSFDLLLRWSPGADQRATRQRLEERVGEVVDDKPPSDVLNLERVTAIPRALALFLGSLAMLAIGHALVVTVRRRFRDLAVLKALGFRPRQVAATVAWQATLLIGAGLVLGVPLGLVAGAWSWGLVTSSMGLANQPEVPFALVAATIPVALVTANLIALVPARSAARANPASGLRVE